MRTDRIDFISAYCDAWCERCAFTMRCSHFAVKMALPMCDGDAGAAIQLAVGRPAPVEPGGEQEPAWWRELPNIEPTDAEVAEAKRLEEARAERIDESPLTTGADAALMLTRDWLEAHRARLASAGPAVAEAIQVVGWDCWLIGAKLHRALHGREAAQGGDYQDDDPVQNDWNGSAKVALLSIDRSAAAWQVIADGTGHAEAAEIARRLAMLRSAVEGAFPDARRFIRPGFDEPDR